MSVLVLGGTRFAGRAVVAELLAAGHAVTVSSRRADTLPEGATGLPGERQAILPDLQGRPFETVIDFTAYDAEATGQALSCLSFERYILISTTWMAKRGQPDLLAATQRYLEGKAGAEALVAERTAWRGTVLRLPVMMGENDHTGRLDFYRERMADGEPLLALNGATNRVQPAWTGDIARAIAAKVGQGAEHWPGQLDGLAPDHEKPLADFLRLVAETVEMPLSLIEVSSDEVSEGLKDYLLHEPFWREQPVKPLGENLFASAGVIPTAPADWLAQTPRRALRPEQVALRQKELDWQRERANG